MPKLVLEKNGQQIEEYIISKQDNVVGRSVGCDLSIADEAISRKHLRIICILGDCFLEDLNSANGTLVNGKLTQKCPLEDGDSILLGQHEIKYEAVESEQKPTESSNIESQKDPQQEQSEIVSSDSENLDATVKIDPSTLDLPHSAASTTSSGTTDTETSEQASFQQDDADVEPDSEDTTRSRTKAEKPETRTGNLKIISGSKQGQIISLHKSVTGIDKGGKRIAAVNKRNDGYFLVPVVDENGAKIEVIVNGQVIKRRIYPLWSNDVIELGESQMEFLLEN